MKSRIWLTAALLSGLLLPAMAQRNPDTPQRTESNAYNLMRESTYNRYVTFNASLRYGVGVPLGTQRTYINQLSPANALVTMEWQFPQNFSLGLQSGYQYSQQRLPRAVYSFPETGEDISAVQTRTLTVTPVLATAAYYFSDPAAPIRPYVQLAGGGAFMNYTNFYGTLADQDKRFAGMIAPAIGVKVFGKREKGLGGEIQAQYQNAFYKYNELNNPSNLMLSAGLTYRFY
ncbi:hypothetical protein FAES_2961 [Fibrella aestuarina BUZ 2]|uniref:Outer membrane protein beta-barrel domain-containing protein n=1 Tax=Fibrella aestuarina BUZ 2 TaxID=1166018 RepID=I0KA17_9BACT|nr:hypothetical protein [Fibrella aestuarina]CCH00970.1 hypothetical protein FAES_2961 [Fibrella aestuarina BUZ 2]